MAKQFPMTSAEMQQAQLKILELKKDIRWQNDVDYRQSVQALDGDLWAGWIDFNSFIGRYFDLKNENRIH